MSARREARTLSAAQLLDRVAHRFAPPGWALFREVKADDGGSRRADAIAMGLWRSRGFELVGFEVKVSRADWLTELRTPEKAEAIARHCDRWYLVVADAALVHEGELPPGWGLLAPRGAHLTAVREAPKLTPEPVPREMLAMVLRSAFKQSADEEQLRLAREEGRREGEELGRRRARDDADLAAREAVQLRESVRRFEEASGVEINAWNGASIGEVVRQVMQARDTPNRYRIEGLVEQLRSTAKQITNLLKIVPPAPSKDERDMETNTPREDGGAA